MNYNPPTYHGPLEKRSCTDVVWLIIFVVFLAGWAKVAHYAVTNGDLMSLIHPTDTEGRKCGYDPIVKNKPYLLFFDLSSCVSNVPNVDGPKCDTPKVCLSECPKTNFLYSVNRTTDVAQMKRILICRMEVRLSEIQTIEQIDMLIEREKCARWYLESKSVLRRCIPSHAWSAFAQSTISTDSLLSAKKAIMALAEVESFFKKSFERVKETKPVIIGIIAATVLLTVIYIIIIGLIATPLVYGTIILVCGLLGFATYQMYLMYQENLNKTSLAFLIVTGALFVVVVLGALFLYKRIYLACQLIKESSRAVTSNLTTLLFPLLPWVLHLIVIVLGVTIHLYLSSIYEPNYRVEMMNDGCSCSPSLNYVNNATCDPVTFNNNCALANGQSCPLSSCITKRTHQPDMITYYYLVNIFGFYWLYFFVSAFGEMVLAAIFATWYWTYKKSDVPYFTISVSIWRTVRYHLGTLAFGSLIITICRMLRLIIEYVNKKVKKANSELLNSLMCCCRFFFWLLEKFLKFINNNAYIMCAVHGKGFCRSAADAFGLLMRNIVRVVVIGQVTKWILLLGRLLIILLTFAMTWWFCTQKIECKYDDANCWIGPALVTTIVSYLLVAVFFSVQTAAIDTIFLCFLEDCEINDGSKERPYYMSKRLRKVLQK